MAKQFKPETLLLLQAGWTHKGEPRVLPIYRVLLSNMKPVSRWPVCLIVAGIVVIFYTRLQNPTNDAVAAKIATHSKEV